MVLLLMLAIGVFLLVESAFTNSPDESVGIVLPRPVVANSR